MRHHPSLIVAAVAFALGAFVFWLIFCRGESAELRRQIDDALAADSVNRARVDSLRSANDSLESEVDLLHGRMGVVLDEVDSLVARPPRVIRVMVPPDTGTGPAVPVDVVLASEHDSLRRACSSASVLCRQTTDSLKLLADRRKAEADKASARADTLLRRVLSFTVPKEPSRWSLAACGGYGVVVNGGEVHAGPGALLGGSFRIF